jgi:hypothetical protein
MSDETEKGPWTCFHCGETFRSVVDARNHFGIEENSKTACQIKVSGEFALLKALRNAEAALARYRAEDSDTLRVLYALEADHAVALRREEEKGYERGVREAREAARLVDIHEAAAYERKVYDFFGGSLTLGYPVARNK